MAQQQECEWCRTPVGGARRFPRVLLVPMDDGSSRKLYFHEKCLGQFKEANPRLMLRKEEEALRK